MASQQSSEEAQFIVVPRTTGTDPSRNPLAELLQSAASRQITVVRVVGPIDRPVRLVLRGPRAVLAELQEHYAQELVFEEDRPLSPI